MKAWGEELKRQLGGLVILARMACGWRPDTPVYCDAYWGLCPHCKRNDGYLTVRRARWYICHRHRLRWYVRNNEFSTWRHETPEGWKDKLALIGDYEVLEWKDVCGPAPDLGDGNAVRASTEITTRDK